MVRCDPFQVVLTKDLRKKLLHLRSEVFLVNEKWVALAIIALLAGTGLGYGLGYFMFQAQISDLKSDVSNLQSELSILTTNYNNLNTTYNDLAVNYSELVSDYENLSEIYVELSQQYEDLLFHYNLINGPASNFTTIKDLQITFTTSRTTYFYEDPVSGNATIKYLNGTAFRGSFSIIIAFIGGGSLSVGERFHLENGFAEFSYGPPAFIYGPGTYLIKLAWIYTGDGFIVADPNTAGLPEVQVEAK